MSVQHMSSANSGVLSQVDIPESPVGFLCRDVPLWVSNPPIESVVFAWGASEDHQLGLDTEQDIYSPKVVESLLGIRFMGRSFGRCPLVGGSRNMLALDADGGLWSWGWNDRGTLGHGHRALQRKPAQVEGLAGVEVVQAAIGGWHCLALDAEGQAFCWGGNEYQQCGWVDPDDAAAPNGYNNSSSSAQQQQQQQGDLDGKGGRWQRSSSSNGANAGGGVHGVLPAARDVLLPLRCMPGLRVKQVACGGMNSVVLTDSGEVWTWGEPWGDFALDIQRAPRKVPGAVNVAAIACGAFHNLALVADGSVLSWGTNDYGQLGNGSTIYSMTPVEVCDLEEVAVADIAAGGWHSMALTADGQIYVWGRGEYGRLGIGDRTGSSKLRPHKVRGLEEHVVVQVAAGGTHSLCVTSAGRMFIWGRASYGRLGLGRDARDCYAPVEVQLPGGHTRWKIAAATAGGRHTMCLAVPVRDGGPRGGSVYANSEGGHSRPASLLNEPLNNTTSSNATTSAAPGSSSATRGGSGGAPGYTAALGSSQAASSRQLQEQGGAVYDPFAAQQQHLKLSSGGRSTPAAPGAAAAADGQAAPGSSAGSSAFAAPGMGSPYQPGGPLPHGPALSMQSSYSLVNSPGSSVLGGSSPPGAAISGSTAGLPSGPWLGSARSGVKPDTGAPSAAAAAGEGGSSGGGGGRQGAAGSQGGHDSAAEVREKGPNGADAAAAAAAGAQGLGGEQGTGFGVQPRSPRSGRDAPGAAAGAAAGAAGSGSAPNVGPGTSPPAAAMRLRPAAAGGSNGGSSERQPCGVEAVHAAAEAVAQQVESLLLHGRLPPGASSSAVGAAGGGGGLHALLGSHGPLAAAAASAGTSGLRVGQGSAVSPRGMPPPMSPSQRAVGLDPGSSLREFVSTGDDYDVTGRGDSIQWQHQAVALELQEREVLLEDDAAEQELHDEQQREADEAALEEAEERREEEVRLKRQEQQQQLREAHMRQQQQQLAAGGGAQQAGSYSGPSFVLPGSNSSSGSRPGSSHGRPGLPAASSSRLVPQMRKSRSHQQLAHLSDPLAAVAALSPRGADGTAYSLQRFSSSPQAGLVAGSNSSGGGHHTQQQQGASSGGGFTAAVAAGRAPLGAVGMPGLGGGLVGGRRATAGGLMTVGQPRPRVGHMDSFGSQEGLPDLEGGSPADSPRSRHSPARAGSREVTDAETAGAAGGTGRGRDSSMAMSQASASSLSGDSSSGQVELGGSPPPSGRYDVALGERYLTASSMPGREQLHLSTHLS